MSRLSSAPRRTTATGDRVTRIYALLLWLAPRAFREAHGAEVAQVFRQLYRDAWAQRGVWGALGFLAAAAGDLLGGILGEYLALCWGIWNRSWVMSRLRSSAILVFCAYIAFVVIGMGFQKMTEDVVKSTVPTAHPGIALAYDGVIAGALIALLATLVGGLPIAFTALRQAIAARRWGIVALFAVPPIALVVWLGWTWTLLNVIFPTNQTANTPPTSNIYVYSWVALFVVAAIASVAAVATAITRSEIRPDLFRFALAPEIGVALGMLVTVAAMSAWGIQMLSDAPNYLAGNAGPLGFDISLGSSLIAHIALMGLATLIVIAGIARGYGARHTAVA